MRPEPPAAAPSPTFSQPSLTRATKRPLYLPGFTGAGAQMQPLEA